MNKENLKTIGLMLLLLLYIGGFICLLVAAFGFFKAFVPVIASLVVAAFSVPSAVKLAKKIFGNPYETDTL